MLEFRQVARGFGSRLVLQDISFQAGPGSVTAVLGPNGAGKTTLLRLAACYLQPTRGRIRLDGRDTFYDSLQMRRRTGYLPERCPLYDDMTVGEYLYYRARLKGLPWRKARRRAREAAAQYGLDEMRGRLIAGLSVGVRRRVGVADALLTDAALLLLDDPLASVDAVETRRILDMVAAAARRAIVLLTGHGIAELADAAGRFLILRAGRVSADVAKAELLALAGTATLEIEVSGASDAALQRLAARFPDGATAGVSLLPEGWWRVSWSTAQARAVRDDVAGECLRQGWRLRAANVSTPSLASLLADLVAGRRAWPVPPAEAAS